MPRGESNSPGGTQVTKPPRNLGSQDLFERGAPAQARQCAGARAKRAVAQAQAPEHGVKPQAPRTGQADHGTPNPDEKLQKKVHLTLRTKPKTAIIVADPPRYDLASLYAINSVR